MKQVATVDFAFTDQGLIALFSGELEGELRAAKKRKDEAATRRLRRSIFDAEDLLNSAGRRLSCELIEHIAALGFVRTAKRMGKALAQQNDHPGSEEGLCLLGQQPPSPA